MEILEILIILIWITFVFINFLKKKEYFKILEIFGINIFVSVMFYKKNIVLTLLLFFLIYHYLNIYYLLIHFLVIFIFHFKIKLGDEHNKN